jgi:hypothetical protein
MMRRPFHVRFFEILPGLLTWSTFVLPIILAFTAPKFVSMAVMIYAIYWFFRTIIMARHLIWGFLRYRQAIRRNWRQDLMIAHPDTWEKVVHLVFVPMYKEEFGTLDATFTALVESDYPQKKIIPILCTEARAGEPAAETAKQIRQKYAHFFPEFYTTVHPADTPGEVKGKGPNISFAAREVVPKLLQSNYSASDVIVTTLDADNRVDRQYFAAVAKSFLESEDPLHSSYQPLPMFFNNIWDVPVFIRMIALGSSFWVMVESTRPHRLKNFSAHSQSLTGLIASDYWSVTTIVEDGHQYWRSFYSFHGTHTVHPIFIPIYMDAVLSHTFWGTVREQYLQKRRWAWGVSDVPFVFDHNIKNRDIPFIKKWKLFFDLFEGHYSWATTSIVLAFAGWPPLLINEAYHRTVLAYNFPIIYSRLLFIAGIGMIVTLVISALILPSPPKRYRSHKLIMIRDWILTPILLPVTNIIFSALPAIDSQTRLMFGKYMDVFRVTEKKVINYSEMKDK